MIKDSLFIMTLFFWVFPARMADDSGPEFLKVVIKGNQNHSVLFLDFKFFPKVVRHTERVDPV